MIKRIFYFIFLVSLWVGGVSFSTVIKSSLVTLFVTYLIIPLIYHYSPYIQRHLVFLTFVNYPKRVDFDCPENEGLPGTRNFYLDTENGIKVGVWHVLPSAIINEAPSKGSSEFHQWHEDVLGDHRPIILYLHGNTASRAIPHRVLLYKVLREMNFHIVAFDYRGYADSTHVPPTETGVVHDAKFVYQYVKNLSRTSPLIVWGHSLGTGVSSHAVGDLCLGGKSPSALILESPFNNIRDEVTFHPLTSIFRKMPCFRWLFLDPLKDTGIDFRSDEHIAHINVPVLILHAKDDLVVPFMLGKRLYESSQKVRPKDFPSVIFRQFDGIYGYGHKFICKSPDLPLILRSFFKDTIRDVNSSCF